MDTAHHWVTHREVRSYRGDLDDILEDLAGDLREVFRGQYATRYGRPPSLVLMRRRPGSVRIPARLTAWCPQPPPAVPHGYLPPARLAGMPTP